MEIEDTQARSDDDIVTMIEETNESSCTLVKDWMLVEYIGM